MIVFAFLSMRKYNRRLVLRCICCFRKLRPSRKRSTIAEIVKYCTFYCAGRICTVASLTSITSTRPKRVSGCSRTLYDLRRSSTYLFDAADDYRAIELRKWTYHTPALRLQIWAWGSFQREKINMIQYVCCMMLLIHQSDSIIWHPLFHLYADRLRVID